MFSVLFEVQPHEQQYDSYLANGKMLHPELEQAPGLVGNIRYKSLTRDGWILSLSTWCDEASVIGWRTRMRGHELEEEGRNQVVADYRLRLGEVTSDTAFAEDRRIVERRLDESEANERTYVTLIDAKQAPKWVAANNAQEIALFLGFDLNSYGDCISWDVFNAVLSPGEIILAVSWKDAQSANDHAATQIVPEGARVRVLRVARDYPMFNREEAQRHHPDSARGEAIRALTAEDRR